MVAAIAARGSVALAEDAGATAAALKGEAAECRYVVGLRKNCQTMIDAVLLLRGWSPLTTEERDAAVQTLRAQEGACTKLADACGAIRAKHEREPACLGPPCTVPSPPGDQP
jgi:hypothetical protein